jgi:hypothetical protein
MDKLKNSPNDGHLKHSGDQSKPTSADSKTKELQKKVTDQVASIHNNKR